MRMTVRGEGKRVGKTAATKKKAARKLARTAAAETTPTAKRAGKKTAAKKRAGKTSAAKKTAAKKRAGKKTAKKKSAGKRAAKKSEGKTTAARKSAGKTAAEKRAGKKTAAKKSAGKTAAEKRAGKTTAARKSAGKTAAEKRAGKKTAAKKSAGKTAAKKSAGKTTAAKKSAKKTAAEKTASVAATPVLAGPLGDWVRRANEMAAQLEAHPQVRVLARWQAPPVDPAVLDAIEAKLGVPLGDAVRNLYLQADGYALAWAAKDEPHKPTRGRPTMVWLEQLAGNVGAIALAPIEEVFGHRRAPIFDYAEYVEDGSSRWGFDFPGNYYTPAFRRAGEELRVQVGDDHAAAWDGPSVTLERYLDNVLATWGSLDARGQHFVRGKGKAVAPVSLATLLPTSAQRDDKKLGRTLDRMSYGEVECDEAALLGPVRQGLRSRDTDIVSKALRCVVQAGARAEVVREDLADLVAREVRLWDVGDALAALPPAPLGEGFLPIMRYASSTSFLYEGVAKTLAASLELDPNPEHVAAWLAALAGESPTVYNMVFRVRAPALLAAAERALAEHARGLDDDAEYGSDRDQNTALAWGVLHPEDVRPALVRRIRDALEEGRSLEHWLPQAATWPVLGGCLVEALRAMIGLGTPEARMAVAEAMARRDGAELSAALNRLLDEDEERDRYSYGALAEELAPLLPLDPATRARVEALRS